VQISIFTEITSWLRH